MKQNIDLEAARPQKTKYTETIWQNIPQLQILVIGDTQTGKTTFANLVTRMGYLKFLNTGNVTGMENCGRINKGGSKTIGCDIFVGIRNFEQQKSQKTIKYPSPQQQDQGQLCLKLYDLTGDKTQRNYLDIYLAKVHSSLNAIIFCFDVTNLKTLSHFKKWISTILMKQADQIDESDQNTNSYQQCSSQGQSNNNINISQENDSFLSYETFKGIPSDVLAQFQIFLVGTKLDMVAENQHQIIRAKIAKQVCQLNQYIGLQVGSYFECEEGQNLFLLSSSKVYESHLEFVRFEQCLYKTLQNKQQKANNNNGLLNFQNEELKPYHFQLHFSFINELMRTDQYTVFSRNMTGPFIRNYTLIHVYFKNLLRKLLCKKKSA